ncbi:hypothetical protein EYF80_030892 [Liparis tanakae]|uniref:Uncharacterized protein n=1 Tax=Liparis tanakae TaxID=230148 RepID=A0A4Z2H1Y3_9TELE|nr:hypothetical protein EYF80_030892 [Liparis tanakae]
MSNIALIRRIRSQPPPSTPILACSKVFFSIIPIAQIAMGAVYLDDCPREHFIPIYLIVAGVFGLVLSGLSCLPCAQTPEDGTANPLHPICAAWNSLTVDPYCNRNLYMFAFWTTTVVYILLALFLVGGCCACVCSFLCGRADPDDDV